MSFLAACSRANIRGELRLDITPVPLPYIWSVFGVRIPATPQLAPRVGSKASARHLEVVSEASGFQEVRWYVIETGPNGIAGLFSCLHERVHRLLRWCYVFLDFVWGRRVVSEGHSDFLRRPVVCWQ